MAKTAVVNRRRGRDGRFRKGGSSKPASRAHHPKRKKNPSRRYYGAAAPRKHKRRRNPSTAMAVQRAYQPAGYRRSNPSAGGFFNSMMEVLPAATGGVWAARWAVHEAGDFEKDDKGALVPGAKHALAIYLAAHFGGQMIGQLLGDPNKGTIAAISALGFGGDMFARKRFFTDSQFVKDNLYLDGVDDDGSPDVVSDQEEPYAELGAYTDAVGNRYVRTAQGWQLAGAYDDPSRGAQRLAGFQAQSALGGFESQSALGGIVTSSNGSSFGYARRY